MRNWIRALLALLCASLLTVCACAEGDAPQIVDEGTCGGNLTWTLDGDWCWLRRRRSPR